MVDIDNLMNRFCKFGAEAMHRYGEVSGEAPDHLPEYFMSSYILDHMGGEIYCTLETVFRKIYDWNKQLRGIQNLPERHDRDAALAAAEHIGAQRVDMVLMRRMPNPPNWDFTALVEFKKGAFSDDRYKLLEILRHIDKCLYGVVCGTIGYGGGLSYWTDKVRKSGDKWFECRVEEARSFFCACLFKNPAYA